MVRMIAPGVAILGRYIPRVYDRDQIRHELATFAMKCKLVPCDCVGGEVRDPRTNRGYKESSDIVNRWHRDRPNTRKQEPYLCMVLWSNREQTEIQLSDGTILKPHPCHVLLIKNTCVLHKTPEIISPDRWFFRLFVREPKWMSP